MDRRNELESFESRGKSDAGVLCREFRIYRSNGNLSVIYFTAFESDDKAISEAEKIARFGYQVDIWRDGTRIDQITDRHLPATGKHRPWQSDMGFKECGGSQ